MRSEVVASILNPQTPNLMSSGGGGFDAIIAGDIYGVMSACEADPLTWAYLFSHYDIGLSYDRFDLVDYKLEKTPVYVGDDITGYTVRYERLYKRVKVSNSLNEFEKLLRTWVYNNYLDWIKEKNIYKALEKATAAVDDITHGLALYLSKDPKRETRIAGFFKPMHHEKFKRNYYKFAIMASRVLYRKMEKLSNQIHEYTKKQQ
jgi:hypothetical protein